MIKLTLIVPVFNHQIFLEKCLDSIVNQETNFKFKALICDDASTDGSSQIILKYARKHPDIIIPKIRENNVGVVENIFDAMLNIEGDYFAFLEGDDYWTHNKKLQMQVDLLDKNPQVDLCGHETVVNNISRSEQSNFIALNSVNEVIIRKGRENLIRPHYNSRVFRNKYNFSIISNKAGLIFDSCIYWYYMLQNPKIIYINKAMSVYNVHEKGMYSGSNRKKRKFMALSCIKNLNEVLENKFHDFTYRRFKKTLTTKYRILFPLFYKVFGNSCYQLFIDRYK